jgi:Cytochrome c, mono- and diheme variants
MLQKTTKNLSGLCVIAMVVAFVACGRRQESGAASQKIDGKAIFDSRCSFCHGPAGAGDTPMASGYPAANLTDSNWTHGGSVVEIEKTISEGIQGTPMAGFNRRMTPDKIASVAEYVKSLSR